jgi:glycosyltransferase involved in cell wall biosynthesis
LNRTPHIVILTGNHICHNPRAFKEAAALTAEGYRLTWLGGWFDRSKAERDCRLLEGTQWNFIPVTEWPSSTVTRHWQRIRRKLAIEAYQRLGFESPLQLGYCVPELLKHALAQSADLYIAHSEPALWVAAQLSKSGHRTAVDMEDWFSEDLLPAGRRGRPVRLLKALEKTLLNNSAYTTCPSHSMSNALAKEYGCEPPAVIYNVFPWKDRNCLDGEVKDRRNLSIPSIHWFSQTIGPGRGLEDLLAALPFIGSDLEIHLRGETNTESREWLEKSIPAKWKTRIFIHQLVHNDELLSRITEHDIGLALDPRNPLNREVTVTNKILQYLLGGLTVIASNTAGHAEVAEQARGAVTLYQSGNAEDLACCLDTLIADKKAREQTRRAALEAAQQTFCWEQFSKHLTNIVRRIEL